MNSKLRKIATDGGSLLPVSDVPGIFGGAAWSPHGKIVILHGYHRVSPYGPGEWRHARKVCRDNSSSGRLAESVPLTLSDGETVLFSSWTTPPFHANYDVSPDGKGFLLLKATQEAEVTVVRNRLDKVRARIRGKERD